MGKTQLRKVIIGYTDEDGYLYCVKHGKSNMIEVSDTDDESGTCCVCNVQVATGLNNCCDECEKYI